MHFATLSGAAVLLALAPSALAVGCATVINNCGFDVYYASVGQSYSANMANLPSSGYTESYSQPGVGISIKLSPDDSLSEPLSQFEFTWADGMISYDLSNINGYPFAAGGISITPSMMGDSAYPTCVAVDCPAGATTCTAAYNQPDDTRTLVCSEDSDLTLTLCPAGGAKEKREPAVNAHAHRRSHARHLLKA